MTHDPGSDIEPLREPCLLVVFGADGDLTKRKLIPSIYNLAAAGLLPSHYAIVGLDRVPMTTAEYRVKITQALPDFAGRVVDQPLWQNVRDRVHYLTADFQNPQSYRKLQEFLVALDAESRTGGNYLFYLATLPSLFSEIARRLGEWGLTTQRDGHWRRIVFEKPFGHDLESARLLNRDLQRVLEENQIYRIDHYLGKETVQNLMVLRFANSIFEPLWNHKYIDHVQITVSEAEGVGTRATYYEDTGALRDMVQNHLLQLLSFIAMEPPNSFEADAVRDEKAKVLRGIMPLTSLGVLRSAVYGQYGAGTLGGKPVAGYRAEPN
ncbi:MAG: glucose-6-phosphate dehydrogenase (NADP(+)), partial [Nitrospira sp.]